VNPSPSITDAEFAQFQRFIFERAGITLPSSKKSLVSGRLVKRLRLHQLASYGDYLALLRQPAQAHELQVATDLLTTNETYFFREPKHFDFLRGQALAARGRTQMFRVWSAASSSGEEAYSIAMVLADCLGEATPWEVLGTDISTRVLRGAQRAQYPMTRARDIAPAYLHRFCLRGTDEYEGTLLIERSLRQHVHFRQVNLNEPLPVLGHFDVVFLRNVMIYFSDDTKRHVVARVVSTLRPGGHLLIGHAETLNDITDAVQPLAPSVYRKPV
jgi:chemotaxis protein methyltransferase CheR